MDIPGVRALPDLTINHDDIETGANKLLNVVKPEWKSGDMEFFPITGGFINKLLGCKLKSDVNRQDAIVVRVHGFMGELNTPDQVAISYALFHAAGCGAILYAVFSNGIAYQYVPGTTLDAVGIREKAMSLLIAKEIAMVHTIDPQKVLPTCKLGEKYTSKQAWVFPKIEGMFKGVPADFGEVIQKERVKAKFISKEALYEEYLSLKKELIELGSPIVFCHNDLNPANIIYDQLQGKVHFVDLEFAGYNCQSYDLACYIGFHCGLGVLDKEAYPDKVTQMTFLRTYLESLSQLTNGSEVTDSEVHRLYVMVNKYTLLFWMVFGIYWLGCLAKKGPFDITVIQMFINTRLEMYIEKKEELSQLTFD